MNKIKGRPVISNRFLRRLFGLEELTISCTDRTFPIIYVKTGDKCYRKELLYEDYRGQPSWYTVPLKDLVALHEKEPPQDGNLEQWIKNTVKSMSENMSVSECPEEMFIFRLSRIGVTMPSGAWIIDAAGNEIKADYLEDLLTGNFESYYIRIEYDKPEFFMKTVRL